MSSKDLLMVEDLVVRVGSFTLGPINMRVGRGSVNVVVGPNGAGKTTLLKAILGVYRPLSGRVIIDGVDVTKLGPERRGLGYVPQGFSLFPNMTVRANIEYGMKMLGVPRRERESRLRELAMLLDIDDLLDRRPNELSGGQQQRVALARALATRPKLLLLDEPLSNLDPTSVDMAVSYLRRVADELSISSITVTHTAMKLLEVADRVFFMSRGRLVDLGSPAETIANPRTLEAARYFGFETFLRVSELRGDQALVEGLGWIRLNIDGLPRSSEGALYLALRPTLARVYRDHYGSCEGLAVRGLVRSSYLWVDGTWRAKVLVNGHELVALAPGRLDNGSNVEVCVDINGAAVVSDEVRQDSS